MMNVLSLAGFRLGSLAEMLFNVFHPINFFVENAFVVRDLSCSTLSQSSIKLELIHLGFAHFLFALTHSFYVGFLMIIIIIY